MQSPSIYQFTTLDAYLGRFFQYRKALNPTFSYSVWARRMGVQSPATLCMVTKGQRSPGKNLVVKFTKDLALDSNEARYFEILVDLKKHRGHLTPSLHLMKELEQKHPDKGFKLIRHDQFKLISNWYYWALLEMVTLKGFKENTGWISEKFEYSVSEADIQEALATLERLDFVARDRNGKLFRTSQVLKTDSDVASQAIREYHSQCLKNAEESLRKHDVSEREFQGLTLSMSPQQMPKAKAVIREFIEEFCRTFDNPAAHRVLQLELSLIPLTKDLREKRK